MNRNLKKLSLFYFVFFHRTVLLLANNNNMLWLNSDLYRLTQIGACVLSLHEPFASLPEHELHPWWSNYSQMSHTAINILNFTKTISNIVVWMHVYATDLGNTHWFRKRVKRCLTSSLSFFANFLVLSWVTIYLF